MKQLEAIQNRDIIEKEYYTVTEVGYKYGVSAQMIYTLLLDVNLKIGDRFNTKKIHRSKLEDIEYVLRLKTLNRTELISMIYDQDAENERLERRVKRLASELDKYKPKLTEAA